MHGGAQDRVYICVVTQLTVGPKNLSYQLIIQSDAILHNSSAILLTFVVTKVVFVWTPSLVLIQH